MSVPTYDVVIIGAGIVGAACAAECAAEGLRVLVIEAETVGGGATAAGMGHIVVMDDSEAQFALTLYSQRLWDELAEELPPSVEYDRCGTIWVAATEDEMRQAERKGKFYSERGVAVELLDAGALREAEPNLRRGLLGGLRVPGDGVIYPPAAAHFLLSKARAHRAELIVGRAVVEATFDGKVRLQDGSSVSSGAVINCAGSSSPKLTPQIKVQKRKGHLVITDRYAGFVRHQLVELGYLESAHAASSDSVAFNVQPRRTGQLLIGSSRQYGAEDARVDQGVLARMLNRAFAFMPGLADLSAIRVWTGFRAATPDNLPLIGPYAEGARLYLATGHEGLGITTSLGTAKLIVAQIMGRTPPIPSEPFLPIRFMQESAHV